MSPDVKRPSGEPGWIGLFDLFRVGIGPSSSHTVGPMVSARRFVREIPAGMAVSTIGVKLFGSLALTGKGHATDTAIVLGLLGHRPDGVDPDAVAGLVAGVCDAKRIPLPGGRSASFDPRTDIAFLKREMLPRHPNALRFTATGTQGGIGHGYAVILAASGHTPVLWSPTGAGLCAPGCELVATGVAARRGSGTAVHVAGQRSKLDVR